MALKLENISYREYLNNLSYEFEKEKINVVLSSDMDKKYLGYLLIGKITSETGIITNTYSKKEIGTNIDNIEYINNSVYDELSSKIIEYNYKVNTINKRIEESLKMVGLSADYLYRGLSTLSDGELSKVKLAKMLLLNPKLLIIDLPNTLDNRDETRIIRLLKKIKREYHKTIVVITSNVNASLLLGDNFLVLRNGKELCSENKKSIFGNIDKLKKAHLNVPKIINFINTANKEKEINLELTDDVKDLMKDIYRNV